ncbi:MAG: hypothetical protein R3A52_11770 [Polyangiales bacterium]
MRPSRLALLAALLLSSSAARAQGLVARLPGLGPTGFSITSTSLLRYRHLNFDTNTHDDEFFSLTERLDLSATAAPWRLYMRVDTFTPWNHDTSCTGDLTSLCYLRSNYRPGSYDSLGTSLPERLSLRYQRGDITFELGDFYQVFGRGLALAFRKVDPIGLDTTLRGGRFEYEHGRLTARVFGGVSNPQNLDPISLSIFDDPTDVLVGGSTAVRLGPDEDIEVSGHVVHANFERIADGRRQDDVTIMGWRVEVPSLLDGNLSLYGEVDVLRRESRTGAASEDRSAGPGDITNGRAVYASAQLTRGPFTFLAEFKDYTHYLLAPTEAANASPRDVARVYSQAPSLERDDQRLFSNSNVRGGRLRVDYNVRGAPWIFTLNSVLYGWADATDSVGTPLDPWDGEHGYITSHTYFGIRRRSRPSTSIARPRDADGQGPATTSAQNQGGAGGANITAGGTAGTTGTRVARGDYNLLATVGYRREFHAGTASAPPGVEPAWQAGDIKHESIQADIDVAFPVGANDSIEVRVDNRFERNFTFDRLTGFDLDQLLAGVRGGIAVSWSHGLPLVVSAGLRWDNTHRPLGEASLGDQPFGTLTPSRLPTLYPNLEVRWNFSISNFVRVFAGMTPGGRVCSGGVCRDVPLFQGAVAELVFRL